MTEQKSKREVLRDKMVDLVKMFVKAEGDITQADIEALFGYKSSSEMAAYLSSLPFLFSG
ncbi:MAG: hypothetical protein HY913_12580 [Desulfomonile tiedjei]|nr:hypothetical protein [Desulfomonile tiedjei]